MLHPGSLSAPTAGLGYDNIEVMSEQLDVLKIVAQRLEKAGIPYMLSGSVAMNFYAQPRMTRDIDIVVELLPKDARRISTLFSSDFYVDEQDVQESIQNHGIFNVIHTHWMVKVDFIVRKELEYRKEEFRRRRSIPLDEAKLCVVAPEDLILSKLDWGKDSRSELQLKDARNLISSVQDLDWEYLMHWSKQLGLTELLDEVRHP